MLCRNKKCNKGNFGKRAKFEQTTPTKIYCSVDCLFEDMKTESYKKEVSRKIKSDETKAKRIFKAEDNKNKRNNPLQVAINKLVKMIDQHFELNTCICCGEPLKGQSDSAHFKSVGSNSTLRYNLHNIHTARGYCNQYNPNHQKNYPSGLEKRYGKEYLDMVEGLQLKYPSLHLSGVEIIEKTKIVRGIINNFDLYEKKSPTLARDFFNQLIGIYT